MQPVSADNPWIASVARGRPLLPAWAVVPLAAAVGAFAIIVGRGLGSKAAGSILTALASTPPPWPGVLAMAAFNLITFGPMAIVAVAACALDRRNVWLSGPRSLLSAAGGGAIGLGGFAAAVALVALAGDVGKGQADLFGARAAMGVLAGIGLFAFQTARAIQAMAPAASKPAAGKKTLYTGRSVSVAARGSPISAMIPKPMKTMPSASRCAVTSSQSRRRAASGLMCVTAAAAGLAPARRREEAPPWRFFQR